jgi:hypothetical protein
MDEKNLKKRSENYGTEEMPFFELKEDEDEIDMEKLREKHKDKVRGLTEEEIHNNMKGKRWADLMEEEEEDLGKSIAEGKGKITEKEKIEIKNQTEREEFIAFLGTVSTKLTLIATSLLKGGVKLSPIGKEIILSIDRSLKNTSDLIRNDLNRGNIDFRKTLLLIELPLSLAIAEIVKFNILGDQRWAANEVNVKNFYGFNNSTPDIIMDNLLMDIKVDFFNKLNKFSVEKELENRYNRRVIAMIVTLKGIPNSVDRALVEPVKSMFLLNRTVISLRLLKFGNQQDRETEKSGTTMKKAFDNLTKAEQDKISTQEIREFLNSKIDGEKDFFKKLDEEVERELPNLSDKLVNNALSAEDMKKLIKTVYRETEDDKNLMEVLNKFQSSKGNPSFKQNEAIERSKELDNLEKILRKQYGQPNMTYFPISANCEKPTGEEVCRQNSGYKDNNLLVKKLLNIFRVESKMEDPLTQKTHINALKRRLAVAIKGMSSMENKKLARENIEILQLEIELQLAEFNKDLDGVKMNNDGSYNMGEDWKVSLKQGIGTKNFTAIVRSNKRFLDLCVRNFASVNKHKGAVDIIMSRIKQAEAEYGSRIEEFWKKQEEKSEKRARETGRFEEIYSLEAQEIYLEILSKESYRESYGKIPLADFTNIIKLSIPKVNQSVNLPIIDYSKSYDDENDQGLTNKLISDFRILIASAWEEKNIYKAIIRNCLFMRHLVLASRINKTSKNGKEGESFLVHYSKQLDCFFVVSTKGSGVETGSIRIVFKAKKYERPFLGLKYDEIDIENSDSKFFVSRSFRINSTFAESWCETLGAALGIDIITKSYGTDMSENHLIFPLLLSQNKQNINLLDANYFILGNLVKKINFGGEEFKEKIETLSSNILISNYFNFITENMTRLEVECEEFFSTVNDVDISTKDLKGAEVIKRLTQKLNSERRILENNERDLKNIKQQLAELLDIVERPNLKNKSEKWRVTEKDMEKIRKYYSEGGKFKFWGKRVLKINIINKISDMKNLIRGMSKRRLRISSLEEKTSKADISKQLVIRNKQSMLTLVYLKQIYTKKIPDDKNKLKNQFFLREKTFNNKGLEDKFSLRNEIKFVLENPHEFMDFVFNDNKTLWNKTNTSLPGFNYFMQKIILKKYNEKGLKGEDKDYINKHPVETAVSSKTNMILSDQEYLFFKLKKLQAENNRKEADRTLSKSKFKKMEDEFDKKVREELIQRIKEDTIVYGSTIKAEKEKIDLQDRENFYEKIRKMDKKTLKEEVDKYYLMEKEKGREYFKIKSDFTADALFKDAKEMKENRGLETMEGMTIVDLLVHDIVTRGTRVILTLELKEQKGSKRAFFVQTVYNRNANQFFDNLSSNILEQMQWDNITKSGMQKYIHMQNLLNTFEATSITGLTGDKTKFGDTHPLRPFLEGIKAKYDSGYITEESAIICIHALLGLLNRKLLVPKDLLDKVKKRSNLHEDEKIKTNTYSSIFEKTAYHKPLSEYIDKAVNEIEDDWRVFMEGEHPFMRKSLIKGDLNDVANKNLGLNKEAGFTLGVMNLEATLIALCATEYQEMFNAKYRKYIKWVVQCHSDDTMHFFNVRCPTGDEINSYKRSRSHFMDEDEKYSVVMGSRDMFDRRGVGPYTNEFIDNCFSKRALEEDYLRGGWYNAINQVALVFLTSRFTGQVMSPAKCAITEGMAEMLQVFNLVGQRTNTGRELNITVPLIRYAVNIGSRGSVTSFSDSLRERFSAANENIINGGCITATVGIQYLANIITFIEFNMQTGTTEYPPEALGAMFMLPHHIISIGMSANTARLLANKIGRKAYKLLTINPKMSGNSELDQVNNVETANLNTRTDSIQKARFYNVKLSLTTDSANASKFSWEFKRLKIKADRIGDAIAEINNEYHREILLRVMNEKALFGRIILKENMQSFQVAKVNLPQSFVESSQMGFRERTIFFKEIFGVTFPDAESFLTVGNKEEIRELLNLQKEMGQDIGFLKQKEDDMYNRRGLPENRKDKKNFKKSLTIEQMINTVTSSKTTKDSKLILNLKKGFKCMRIKDYQNVIHKICLSLEEEELPDNSGFDFLMNQFQNRVNTINSIKIQVIGGSGPNYNEPNKYVKMSRSRSYKRVDDILPALSLCSEFDNEPNLENIKGMIWASKTKSLVPSVLTDNYKFTILEVSNWVKILLGDYWKIKEKTKITGLGEILKDYINEEPRKLIYKSYGANNIKELVKMYEENYSVVASLHTSHKVGILYEEEERAEYLKTKEHLTLTWGNITSAVEINNLGLEAINLETSKVVIPSDTDINAAIKEVLQMSIAFSKSQFSSLVTLINRSISGVISVNYEVKEQDEDFGDIAERADNEEDEMKFQKMEVNKRKEKKISRQIKIRKIKMELEDGTLEKDCVTGFYYTYALAEKYTRIQMGNAMIFLDYAVEFLEGKDPFDSDGTTPTRKLKSIQGDFKGDYMDVGKKMAYLVSRVGVESATIKLKEKTAVDIDNNYIEMEKFRGGFIKNKMFLKGTVFDFTHINIRDPEFKDKLIEMQNSKILTSNINVMYRKNDTFISHFESLLFMKLCDFKLDLPTTYIGNENMEESRVSMEYNQELVNYYSKYFILNSKENKRVYQTTNMNEFLYRTENVIEEKTKEYIEENIDKHISKVEKMKGFKKSNSFKKYFVNLAVIFQLTKKERISLFRFVFYNCNKKRNENYNWYDRSLLVKGHLYISLYLMKEKRKDRELLGWTTIGNSI